jgi:hypothetical protein
MAGFRNPFTGEAEFGSDPYNTQFEYHQFGSAEEAREFFEGRNRRRRRPKSEIKTHIFQGFKDVVPGRFEEISLADIEKISGKQPKVMNTPFYYVVMRNNEYYIEACFPAIILYEHTTNDFLYGRPDGSFLPERNVFKTDQEAYNMLKKSTEKYCGATTKITTPDGFVIKLDPPLWPSDHKDESNE